MKIFRWAVPFLAALGVYSSLDAATFLNTKADWDRMSVVEQSAYVMGAFDNSQMVRLGDGKNTFSTDLGRCVTDLGLTSKHMIDAVNAQYSDLSMWEFPPYAVLGMGLRKVCLAHINRARSERGEAPLD
ncbi:MAG: hypothetical protein JWP57_4198 [Spirosoma sp.]|nr:hypothetical protein [Spirosoma sp.]